MGDLGIYGAIALALVALLKAMTNGYGGVIKSLKDQNDDQQYQINDLKASHKDCLEKHTDCQEKQAELLKKLETLQAQVDSLRAPTNGRRKK